MTQTFDVAVVGLGAHGSATTFHLARRGLKVVGFDRFSPPHDQGSSTGETRIIREAYHENPVYVPLVQRAYELWGELERESGRKLYHPTRGLMIGPPSSDTVAGARRSADMHGIPYEMLTAAEIRNRFPAYNPSAETVALLEARAGALFPDACIHTHLEQAKRQGAVLRPNEAVVKWKASERRVRIQTARNEYAAERVILTAGAWLAELVPDLGLPLRVERQVMYWFEPRMARAEHGPDRFPIFIWEFPGGRSIYGFPNFGSGMKIGIHHEGSTVDPNRVPRNVEAHEIAEMREIVRRCFPGADGPPRAAKVCLYTDTPDYAFLVDFHPRHQNVVIGSPCSGHGFKFASAMGEALADLATKGKGRFDLSVFRASRWPKP